METDILLTIVLSVASLIFPKSKFFAGLFFLFMWTLWGWNTWNGDYEAYEKMFLGIEEGVSAEGGYWLLNSFFRFFINDFQTFLIIISFLVLFSVYKFVIAFSPYPALFSLLYFVIFIMEFVFIRDYIASTFFIVALGLVFREKKHKVAYFVLLLLLASSIHTFYLLFFIFLPCIKSKSIFPLHKWFKYIVLINIFVILAGNVFIPYLGNYIGAKVAYYAGTGGITTSSYALLLIVLIVTFTRNILLNVGKEKIQIKVLYNINVLSLLFVGIFFYIPYASSRFLRVLFVLDILFMMIGYFYAKGLNKKIIAFCLLFLISIISAFFLEITSAYTIIPLYECNIIWGDEYYIPILD